MYPKNLTKYYVIVVFSTIFIDYFTKLEIFNQNILTLENSKVIL